MSIYRDIQLKREERLDRKQDRLPFRRAVLVTSGGLQTAADPFTDVWAAEDERRVWHMTDGATQPGQILCRRISDPYVGLGVIIGYADGSNEQEVLTDDFFLTKTGDPTAWHSTAPRDFEPGGRKQLWVYPKVITPLATYPDPSGLTVNIIRGDYPYAGTRKTFTGEQSYSLTAPVTSGHHYYAGLYLDSSNTLQVVYGTSVALAFDPIEPTWPAGAFRLSVVLIENGQTSIDFAEDVYDRRMLFSEAETSSGGGWPFTHVLTVSSTNADADYTTLADAITAATAGDVILIEDETISDTATVTVSKALTIESLGGTVITNSITNAPAFDVTADNVIFRNLTLRHTGAGTTSGVIATDNAGLVLDNCLVEKVSGAATNAYALWMFGGSVTLKNGTRLTCTSGTNRYGIYNTTAAATIVVEGGRIEGTTYDVFGSEASSTILLNSVLLANGAISFTGTIRAIPIHTKSLTTEFFSKFGGLSSSDFVATIASKSGSTLVYNAPSAGNENNLANDGTGYAAKMLLWNTTRSEYLLIDQNNPGTNTITFTTAVPAGWVATDTITIRSQTNTSNPIAGVYFTDWEVSTDISIGTRALELKCWFKDSALGAIIILHPYEANSNAKRDTFDLPVAAQNINQIFTTVSLTSRRFTMAWIASGAGTLNISARLKGERAF